MHGLARDGRVPQVMWESSVNSVNTIHQASPDECVPAPHEKRFHIKWDVMEDRFGPAGLTVSESFGTSYVNGIQGWQFPAETLAAAEGRLLTMDLDFPGDRCALNCVYCFAKSGEETGTYYRPDKGDSPLGLADIRRVVIEAKDMGLRSIKIIGYREPFDNLGIHDFIEFSAQQGIHLVIFTAGYTLGEQAFGGSVSKAIDFLARRPVSLMVKMHSLDRETEDAIVRRKGYAQQRDRYLRELLEDGRFTAEACTRLGIENVISVQDVDELCDMYEYFKLHRNVFVDIDPPIPVGRTATLREAERSGCMSQSQLKDLAIRIYQLNQRHGIPFHGFSPFFGAPPCGQLPIGLYVTLSGRVLTCCGSDEELGNVKVETLRQTFARSPYRNPEGGNQSCPYRDKKGMLSFADEVERRFRQAESKGHA